MTTYDDWKLASPREDDKQFEDDDPWEEWDITDALDYDVLYFDKGEE